MEALVNSVPKLASQLGSSVEDAHHAAVAITTTDLVSKSAALEVSRDLEQGFQAARRLQQPQVHSRGQWLTGVVNTSRR